jgi:outer membrane biogenesis lipoprotein LolB
MNRMNRLVPLIAAAALCGCGLDTATSAATAASLKKQELEQGKKTMEQAQQKIGQAMDQVQQSQQSRENAAEK